MLLSDAAALPGAVAEYLALVSSVVGRLVTRCTDRYSERCRGVFSAQRLLDPATQQSMEAEPAFTQIIMRQQEEDRADTAAAAAHRDSSDGSGGSNGAASASPAPPSSSASPAASPLLPSFLSPDFRLRVDQLLSEPRAIAELCLVQDSCEWLADQLHAWRRAVSSSGSSTRASQQAGAEALSPTAAVSGAVGAVAGTADWSRGPERKGKRDKSTKTKAKLRASGPSAAAAASPALNAAAAVSGAGGALSQAASLVTSATADWPHRFRLEEQAAREEAQGGVTTSSGGSSSGASSPPLSALVRGLLPLCSSLLSLSTRCLLTLRCDFQCALFAFLSLQRESSYALTARPAEPEPFVLSLNAHLAMMDESLSRHCDGRVAEYVQSGCFALLSLLCRRIVCQLHDRRVSAAGVLQLQLNLFAVQQQLVNAMRSPSLQEAEAQQFDLAVYFLDLLLCDEEELLSGEHGQLLTADELRGIAAISRQR